MSVTERTIYASCIEFEGAGIAICGGSGSGKTTLMLAMLRGGAAFVADDAVRICVGDNALWAEAVDATRGLVCLDPPDIIRLEDIDPKAKRADAVHLAGCIVLDEEGEIHLDKSLALLPRKTLTTATPNAMATAAFKFVRSIN